MTLENRHHKETITAVYGDGCRRPIKERINNNQHLNAFIIYCITTVSSYKIVFFNHNIYTCIFMCVFVAHRFSVRIFLPLYLYNFPSPLLSELNVRSEPTLCHCIETIGRRLLFL